MTDLLPCPFCGGAAVLRKSIEEYPAEGSCSAGEYEAWVKIACDNCGVEIGDEYRSDATTAWNRRAQPAVTEAQAGYGILWRMRTTDKAIHAARRALLKEIGKDGQRAGLEWALRTFDPLPDAMAERSKS